MPSTCDLDDLIVGMGGGIALAATEEIGDQQIGFAACWRRNGQRLVRFGSGQPDSCLSGRSRL